MNWFGFFFRKYIQHGSKDQSKTKSGAQNIASVSIREDSQWILNRMYTVNPFPVMKTGFSLCSFSHREIPVMKTGSLL